MFMNRTFWHDGGCGMEGMCRGRCSRDKCKDCCKSFTAFLFSTLGLAITVVAYSAAGGFLFNMIEIEAEKKDINKGRQLLQATHEKYLQKLWNMTFHVEIYEQNDWKSKADPILVEYETAVFDDISNHKWDGLREGDPMNEKWNFPGALLYAVTAITTIGYGHVTPKTDWGMIATMGYSLLGLPLTLMCIANVGKFFARIFKIIYHTCFCGICCVCCLAWRRKRAMKKIEENNNGSITSLNRIGNGTTLTITNDPTVEEKPPQPSRLTDLQVWVRNVRSKFSHSMQESSTVPAWVCLVVMGSYITAGALLFSIWEKWSYIEGAYFCFVTLTTIGFGDFVPGMSKSAHTTDEDITEKLVLCAIYVLFGLALIGMCIDLMQADVINKIKWIAKKVGLMEDKKKTRKKRKKIGKQPENDSTIHQLVSASLPEKDMPDSDEEEMQVVVSHSDDNKISLVPTSAERHRRNLNHSNNNGRKPFHTESDDIESNDESDVTPEVAPMNRIHYHPHPKDCLVVDIEGNAKHERTPPPAYTEELANTPTRHKNTTSPPNSCYDNLGDSVSTPLHTRLSDVESPLLQSQDTPSEQKTLPIKRPLMTSKSHHNFNYGSKGQDYKNPVRREQSESNLAGESYDFLDQILNDPVFRPVQSDLLPKSVTRSDDKVDEDFKFSMSDLPPIMSASRTSDV